MTPGAVSFFRKDWKKEGRHTLQLETTEMLREAIAGEGGAYEAPLAVLREAPPSPTCHWAIGLQQTRRCYFFLASARTKQPEASSNAKKNRCGGLSAPLAYAHARGIRVKTPPVQDATKIP